MTTHGSNRPPPVIGLTGGIAAGKSSVSGFLRQRGAHVIDADSVGHAVIAPGGEAFDEVVAEFGEDMLGKDGAIDRRKLGMIVFSDPAHLEKLNAISHPRMAERMAREIATVRAASASEWPLAIILDAAILFEAGWEKLCDEVWVVMANTETSVARLMARNGFSREEALDRVRAQIDPARRTARASHVIRNDGTLADLESALEALWPPRN